MVNERSYGPNVCEEIRPSHFPVRPRFLYNGIAGILHRIISLLSTLSIAPSLCFQYHLLFPYPLRSTLFSFRAVMIWLLVLCPLTGKLIACLRPRYAPISRNRLMLSCNWRRRSFSSVIVLSSAASEFICRSLRFPMRAVLWMWNLAINCWQTLGPMP